jgi:hypothetical protein
MPKSRRPVKAKQTRAKSTPKKGKSKKTARKRVTAQLWLGTGLCPEAQGDGLPCQGVQGECERCGRALRP